DWCCGAGWITEIYTLSLHDALPILVDVRVLVAAGVLDEVVDVDTHLALARLVVVDAHDDPVRVDVVDDTAALGGHDRARVDRARSEEHTSELQSRENLVCRLLLETK